ncbi:MAG: ABC transporter ATP-binding protein [Opitutales bacterium]
MKNLLKFYVYVKPCYKQLIFAIIFGVLFGLSSGFGVPFIIKYVFSSVFEGQDDPNRSLWIVLGSASLLPLIFLMRALFGYVSSLLMTYTAVEVSRNIRNDIFKKIQSFPIAFFEKFSTGDLFVRLNGDTSAIQITLLSFASEIFRQPLQVLGAVIFLVYTCISQGEALVILIVIAAVPFCILPVQMIRKNMKRFAGKVQVKTGEMAQLFGENIDAVHEVRVFSLQDTQQGKYDDFNKDVKNLSLKMAKYELMQQPFMEFLSALLIAVTFLYCFYEKVSFALFSAIGAALYFTIDPIKRILRMSTDLIKTTPMFERISEILEYKSSVPEPENPVEFGRLKGEITFENVEFAYTEKSVLNKVNIVIPAGTSCALVGESGAGKSTFAKLAMRLYDPISGNVKIDGINLRDIRSKDFFAQLGSVSQYPVLFNDTIYNNIAIAKPSATREEIEEAAKLAYAHEFISGLENGYDTLAGERGDRLSGGQKQRVALARVFLKNPPIIVLDEATSALDVNSEAFIQKAVDTLMQDRTMLIIAHRFSTIRNAQKIIVFSEGNIVDYGTHDELIERCQHYIHLYNKQSNKTLEQ